MHQGWLRTRCSCTEISNELVNTSLSWMQDTQEVEGLVSPVFYSFTLRLVWLSCAHIPQFLFWRSFLDISSQLSNLTQYSVFSFSPLLLNMRYELSPEDEEAARQEAEFPQRKKACAEKHSTYRPQNGKRNTSKPCELSTWIIFLLSVFSNEKHIPGHLNVGVYTRFSVKNHN